MITANANARNVIRIRSAAVPIALMIRERRLKRLRMRRSRSFSTRVSADTLRSLRARGSRREHTGFDPVGCVSIRVTVAVLKDDRASSRKLALTLAVYAVERVRRLRFVQADVVSECPRAGLLSVAKFVAAVRSSVLTRMFVRLPTEEPGAPRSGQAVQYLGVMGNQVANSMSHELQLKTTRAKW